MLLGALSADSRADPKLALPARAIGVHQDLVTGTKTGRPEPDAVSEVLGTTGMQLTFQCLLLPPHPLSQYRPLHPLHLDGAVAVAAADAVPVLGIIDMTAVSAAFVRV